VPSKEAFMSVPKYIGKHLEEWATAVRNYRYNGGIGTPYLCSDPTSNGLIMKDMDLSLTQRRAIELAEYYDIIVIRITDPWSTSGPSIIIEFTLKGWKQYG
jgi:hypothetical protein